jgi:hypothetical protein
MTVTMEEIKASGILTQEMKNLLEELNRIITYTREGGRELKVIHLNRKQWEPIRKDRRRAGWKEPRPCGLIHYKDSEPTFDGVTLRAPSSLELREYLQEDAFK